MTTDQFRLALASLGISQAEFAVIIDRTPTMVSRWAQGNAPIPKMVCILLTILKPGDMDTVRAAAKTCSCG